MPGTPLVEKEPAYRRIKRPMIGLFFVLITLGFLAYKILSNPGEIWPLFAESNKTLVLVLIGLQILGFLVNSLVSNRLLRFVGRKVRYRDNLMISVMNEFGNNTMPVVGGSFTSYLGHRRLGIDLPAIIFLETTWAGLLLSQYLLFFCLSLLFVPRSYISLVPKIVLWVAAVGAVVLFVLWYTMLRRQNVDILRKHFGKIIKFVETKLPWNAPENHSDHKLQPNAKTVAENFSLLFSQKKSAATVFLLTSLYFFFDALMLYVAFLTFGFLVPLPIVIFGLLLSLFISALTLVPGQPGVTETSLVLMFTAFGVSSHVAILATILFRITSYWMWLPISVYLVFGKGKKLENAT